MKEIIEALGNLVQLLIKPAVVAGFGLICIAVLFIPPRFPQLAPLQKFVAPFQGPIQLGAVGFPLLFLTLILSQGFGRLVKRWRRRQARKGIREILRTLSVEEKALLSAFNGARSLHLPPDDRIVSSLVNRGILSCSGFLNTYTGTVPTHIDEYVWHELNKYPELLA